MKLKIFVLGHKDFDSPYFDPKYMVKLFNYQCHNNLDNWKDHFYYETYMIYEVYEHLYNYLDDDTEYIGFCHYRRYFDINYDDIVNQFDNRLSDVVLFYPTIYYDFNIHDVYCMWHDNTDEDWDLIRYIVSQKYPKYLDTLDNFLQQNQMSLCNCFITNIDRFKDYCRFVFSIIEQYRDFHNFRDYKDVYKYVIEHPDRFKNLNLKTASFNRYSTIEYNAKIGGFLIERLLNVYFLHTTKNITYMNMIFDE